MNNMTDELDLKICENMVKVKFTTDFKCEQCGKCCNFEVVCLDKNDIKRIAKFLNETLRRVMIKFVRNNPVKTSSDKYAFKISKPCIFQDKRTKRCKIYNARPDVCRGYPVIPVVTGDKLPNFCEGTKEFVKKFEEDSKKMNKLIESDQNSREFRKFLLDNPEARNMVLKQLENTGKDIIKKDIQKFIKEKGIIWWGS